MDNLPRSATEYRAWWETQTDISYGHCWCGCGERTRIAHTNDRRYGLIKGEPRHYINGHNRRKYGVPHLAGYTVDEQTGCWIWQGGKNRLGYGSFSSREGNVRAHRFYYETVYGPIPAGLVIDHLCRNPSCVNPDHLEAVSQKQNVRRGKCPTITEAQAREVKRLDATGRFTKTQIVERTGVKYHTVRNILRGLAWTDV